MMTMIRRRTFGAAIAGLVLLASACGSDGSDPQAEAPTTTAPDGQPSTTATDDGATGDADISGPLERYADYQSENYDDGAHWLCRPDTEDACDQNLDTTVIEADGTTSVEPFEAAEDPPIDCFYVYPTVSTDKTTYSDWDISGGEEGYTAAQQAARLQSQCRLFAPVYRQRTLVGISGGGEKGAGPADPFADVLDAFKTYMAADNDGRGVVLVGHSQGTGMLNQLIASEIDPNEDVRAKLVGAYLAGGSVEVPEGDVVGGAFENIPLCTSDGEVGCITTWASFRSTAPPPEDAYFGRVRGQSDGVAGCVNPAAPGSDEPTELHAYVSAKVKEQADDPTAPSRWLDGAAGVAIDTPFVAVPGMVSGRCVAENGFTYLEVTVEPQPDGPRADDITGDLSPQWGLHLVDLNLVMGDVVDRVAGQAQAYGS